jgi:2'-5' RNA ligase
MSDGQAARPQVASADPDLERFRNLELLANHWSRPSLPRSYYWYLTFPDAAQLRVTAARCQQAITFAYYDRVRPESLHLTLARIGPQTEVTPAQLNAVEVAARHACQKIAPFTVTTGSLAGTRSAVGFSVTPAQPVRALSGALCAATRSAGPDLPSALQQAAPHVTIAYANTDGIPAAEIIATVDELNTSITPAEIPVSTADLVLLERREHAYHWHLISRIPLTETRDPAPSPRHGRRP